MSTWRIETVDDTGCGITVTSAATSGYILVGIETGDVVGIEATREGAIRRAGEYLMAYATDAVAGYPDPDGDGAVLVDWSATVAQGRRMVASPADYRDFMDAALAEDDDAPAAGLAALAETYWRADTWRRGAMADVQIGIREAASTVSESELARITGLTRMTVRKALGKDTKTNPQPLAQFASAAIKERPGMSTADLGAALGRPVLTVKEIDGLHRYGRSFGFGQDGDGLWFTATDSPAVMDAYLQARRTPGAQAFFADDYDGAGALLKAERSGLRTLSTPAAPSCEDVEHG